MPSPVSAFAATIRAKLNDLSVLICNAHGEVRGAWLHLHDTLHLYRLDLASDDQKDHAEAQFEASFQELERHVREQRSTTLAIVEAAANIFNQQYQALQHENDSLRQHVQTLSPPSPVSVHVATCHCPALIRLCLPGFVL